MNPILQQIQYHAAALPLSAQAELLNYAVYLEQKVQEKAPDTSTQAHRDRLTAALAQAVALNPFAEVADPVDWQRKQRQDRSLPGRNDAVEVEETQQPDALFDPHLFFGVAHQPQQVIDDGLTSACEGWR